MDIYDFSTVEKVVNYVRPKIDAYRQFPSKKELVIKELTVVFDIEAEGLAVVVKDGRFVESFYRKMGKGRMRALKRLLYVINADYYKQIDFMEQ